MPLTPSAAIPTPIVEITQAELGVEVGTLLGDPFGGLGQLGLEHATFAAIGLDAFGAEGLAPLGSLASAQAGNVLNFAVLAALQSDLASGGRSQYRLRFQTASDNDAATDLILLLRASATLRLSYLVP